MKAAVVGLCKFHEGSFEDRETKKRVPFYQLGIVEESDYGLKLVKVKVSKDHVNEARSLNHQIANVVCEMRQGENKTDFIYESGKVHAAK